MARPKNNVKGARIVDLKTGKRKTQKEGLSKKEKREYADNARIALIGELGMNPDSAFKFIGKYPVGLAYALVKWFSAISAEVRYRDILQEAQFALMEMNSARLNARFGDIPDVVGLPTTVYAIIFIAESFEIKINGLAKAGGADCAEAKAEA